MGSPHRHVLIAVVAGVCGCGAAAAAFADGEPATSAAPATLTVPENTKLAVVHDYGEHRNARTFTLTYATDANKVLPAAPSVTADEPRTSDGRVFDGTVSATTELAGAGTQVKIAVTVDPDDGVKPGTYVIPLHVASTTIKPLNFSPEVMYTHTPPLFLCWILAAIALIFGLGGGGLLRWLSETGAKLHDALWRRDVLASSLKGTSPLPPRLNRDLATLDLVLARGDPATAKTLLDVIEPKLPALYGALDALSKQRAELERQRTSVALMGVSADVAGRLTTVILREEALIEIQLDGAWPDREEGPAERTALAATILGFTGFLNTYAVPANRDAPGSHFTPALNLYVQGDFAGAQNEWAQDQAAALAAEPPAETAPEVPASAGGITTWAARNAPILIGLLTGFGLAVVGLLTVFKPATMFLTDDVRDFLLLVAWGFGSALTGMTLSQLAGKATGTAGG